MPDFNEKKDELNKELEAWFHTHPQKKFFAVVQHDDGTNLTIPKNTLIFGGSQGDIPLPLIYEDIDFKMEREEKVPFEEKSMLVSFIGSCTHTVRSTLIEYAANEKLPWAMLYSGPWTINVSDSAAERFIEVTKESKFVLAPRGYGRSSFRFFEVLQLGSIPVYIYDDIEWLPYKDVVDYSKMCISIHVSDIAMLQKKLESVSKEEYESYLAYYNNNKHLFTLDGMNEYILICLKTNDYFK
jgi:hypothetical protein